MQSSPFLKIALVIFAMTIVAIAMDPFIPSRDHLQIFIPYSSKSMENSILPKEMPPEDSYGRLVTEINGPFGKANASFSTVKNVSLGTTVPIASYNYIGLPSFSISFWFYTDGNQPSGLISLPNVFFIASTGDKNRSIEIWSKNVSSSSVDPELFKILQLSYLVQLNSWNMLTVTYHEEKDVVELYDQYGVYLGSSDLMKLDTNKTDNRISLLTGFGLHDDSANTVSVSNLTSVAVQLSPNDAMACVMVFDSILTPAEIKTLPGACYHVDDPPTFYLRDGFGVIN